MNEKPALQDEEESQIFIAPYREREEREENVPTGLT